MIMVQCFLNKLRRQDQMMWLRQAASCRVAGDLARSRKFLGFARVDRGYAQRAGWRLP